MGLGVTDEIPRYVTDEPADEPEFDPAVDKPTQPGGFGASFEDRVNYNLYNGVFAKGPPLVGTNLTPFGGVGSNFMPNWRFVQSSNTAITASHVRDTLSPSGSNVRFTFASGAASDEAFVEQYAFMGGARDRVFATAVRASFVNNGATTFTGWMQGQYVNVDGTIVGSSVSASSTVASGASYNPYVAMGSPPATAYSLRVRAGARRGATATSATGSLDLASIRLERTMGRLLLPEETSPSTYSAASIRQASSIVVIDPARGDGTGTDGEIVLVTGSTSKRVAVQVRAESQAWVSLDAAASGGRSIYLGSGSATPDARVFRFAANQVGIGNILVLPEQGSSPSTPASGYALIYTKTDGKAYHLNDAGTETQVGGGSSWDATITKSANQSRANTTLVADTELFVTLASGLYELQIVLIYSNAAGGAPDFKVELGEDATGRSVLNATGVDSAEVDTSVGQRCRTGITTAWGTTTSDRTVFFQGIYNSNGGTFQVSWAQNTANATATIVKANSFLRYKAL